MATVQKLHSDHAALGLNPFRAKSSTLSRVQGCLWPLLTCPLSSQPTPAQPTPAHCPLCPPTPTSGPPPCCSLCWLCSSQPDQHGELCVLSSKVSSTWKPSLTAGQVGASSGLSQPLCFLSHSFGPLNCDCLCADLLDSKFRANRV